jgi:3-deoxy-D-manno-octulosonic-acid transferase
MGPHYANFRAITEDLLAHNAIHIAPPDQLAATLLDLLSDQTAAQALGTRARQVFEQQAGATARCVAAIRALIPDHTPSSAPEPAVFGRRA